MYPAGSYEGTIVFEGQEITYSSFAARSAHRLGVPSVFCAPRWEGDRIGFVVERLPDPYEEEDADSLFVHGIARLKPWRYASSSFAIRMK